MLNSSVPNTLTLQCRASYCNGYPSINMRLDGNQLPQVVIDAESFEILIELASTNKKRTLTIERHGKTDQNIQVGADGNIVHDQYLEIIDFKVDGISVPDFIMNASSRFEFNNECHHGSRFFGPNGVWTFDFETPIIQHMLDQKISHEVKFGNDHLLPWSYKLSPGGVSELVNDIDAAINKVNNIL